MHKLICEAVICWEEHLWLDSSDEIYIFKANFLSLHRRLIDIPESLPLQPSITLPRSRISRTNERASSHPTYWQLWRHANLLTTPMHHNQAPAYRRPFTRLALSAYDKLVNKVHSACIISLLCSTWVCLGWLQCIRARSVNLLMFPSVASPRQAKVICIKLPLPNGTVARLKWK